MQKNFLTFFLILSFLLLPITESPALGKPSCSCGDYHYHRELHETKPSMQGEDIRELQLRLQQLGFFQDSCDGVYGPSTATAVRNFQKAKKLPAKGSVDQATWKALGDGCEHPVTTPPDTPPSNVSLFVDLENLTLTVLEGNRPFRKYPVAIGKHGTPSPIGEWKITDKDYDWGGAFGVRWMGLNTPWGNYGIHGTNNPWSIGSPVSAGCIRMFNEDVLQIFEWVPVGTRVKIHAPLTWLKGSWYRTLKKGLCGQDVVYAQLLLREAGFNPYYCDGWYGSLTELAVKSYQLHTGLPVTGEIDEKTINNLEKGIE